MDQAQAKRVFLVLEEERRRHWVSEPLEFARSVRFDPDDTQLRILRSKARKILVNCTRQWGKSTIVALKVAHHLLTVAEAAVVIISPSLRQSKETLRKVRRFLRFASARLIANSAQEIELDNGSRVLALPGQGETVVGFSALTMLVEDEASIVPDDIFRRMRPMLAVTETVRGFPGVHVMMSTPFGKRGHFYEQWSGALDWERYQVRAQDCSRIPAEFLEEERVALGPAWFAQEYCCEFNDLISSFFDPAAVSDAFVDLPPLESDDSGIADIPALVA